MSAGRYRMTRTKARPDHPWWHWRRWTRRTNRWLVIYTYEWRPCAAAFLAWQLPIGEMKGNSSTVGSVITLDHPSFDVPRHAEKHDAQLVLVDCDLRAAQEVAVQSRIDFGFNHAIGQPFNWFAHAPIIPQGDA